MDLKKEIAQAITDNQYESLEKVTTVILSLIKAWGEEPCPHESAEEEILDSEDNVIGRRPFQKHKCDECWKELGK